VPGQVGQFAAEAIVAARPEPVRRITSVARARPQVQFDGQLQMMRALAVAQQNVQLAQGPSPRANRQVGRQQLDPGRLFQGELPQSFVVQPQAPAGDPCQPVAQGQVIGIQCAQPVVQVLRIGRPGATRQRMALGAGRGAE